MATAADLALAAVGAYAGSQGSKDKTTTTTPHLFNNQEEGIEQFINRSRAQYNNGGMDYYPGHTVAKLNPLQIQGQNAALGNVGAQNALGQMGAMSNARMAGGGANRVGGFQLANQVGFGLDQGLESAVTNPIMRDLQQRVLPSMDLEATSQGAFGGSRAQQMKGQAGAEATGRMTEALSRANLSARQQSIGQRAGDISAQISGRSQDIQQNQLANSAMAQSQAYMPQAMAGLNSGANTMMGVGNQRFGYEQQLVDSDKARFDFGQQENVNNLSRLGDRMMQPMFGGKTSTVQGQDGSATNIVGGAMAGYNFLNNGNPAAPAVTPAPVGSLYDGNFNAQSGF